MCSSILSILYHFHKHKIYYLIKNVIAFHYYMKPSFVSDIDLENLKHCDSHHDNIMHYLVRCHPIMVSIQVGPRFVNLKPLVRKLLLILFNDIYCFIVHLYRMLLLIIYQVYILDSFNKLRTNYAMILT